jgi:hypothetical protein
MKFLRIQKIMRLLFSSLLFLNLSLYGGGFVFALSVIKLSTMHGRGLFLKPEGVFLGLTALAGAFLFGLSLHLTKKLDEDKSTNGE